MHNTRPPDGPPVLIAEDDPEIRSILQWLLHDAGYRPLLAADGRAALALAECEKPALILLDLGLPLMDGPELCRTYREHGGEAPVVLVTAAIPEAVTAAMEACRAAAYIPKPFEINDVLETIAGLIAR